MKKLIIIFLFIPLVSFGQETFEDPEFIETTLETPGAVPTHIPTDYSARYKLYKTDNRWTFLKLDTATGEINQMQYSVNENLQGEVALQWRNLNLEDMSIEEMATLDWKNTPFPNNRYVLKPTENMYNFILLDQTDGRMWQIQWSMNEDERGIVYDYQKK